MDTYKVGVTLNGKPKHPYLLAYEDNLDDIIDKLYGFLGGVYLSGDFDRLDISIKKVGK